MRLKKIVKLTDHTDACNGMTSFERQVHAETGNGNAVNLSECLLKKIRETTSSKSIFSGF